MPTFTRGRRGMVLGEAGAVCVLESIMLERQEQTKSPGVSLAKQDLKTMSSEGNLDQAPDDIIYPATIPFLFVHVSCLAAIWSGITWHSITLCVALYWLRIFAIGAGYHRYFSHRSYSTGRVFQFVMAFLAQTSAQRSVLWWAAKHRHHHLYSDLAQDVHSPRQKGFLYSHVGWIFDKKHDETDFSKIKDLVRYPELMWLHRFEVAPAVLLGAACFAMAGWSGLVVGFLWSTVLVYHATFGINSLAHVRGRKRYVTGDESRNNWLLALSTMGEGWHNNHHACQISVRQGFRWWEIDPTFYILKVFSWFGLVWGLKTPPKQMLRNEHRLSIHVINRAAEELTARFDSERIALAIALALCGRELSLAREAFARARSDACEALAKLHLPQIPDREAFLAEARGMFVRTVSLDRIVDRAYELLLVAVGVHLAAMAEG